MAKFVCWILRHTLDFEAQDLQLFHDPRYTIRHHAQVFTANKHGSALGEHRPAGDDWEKADVIRETMRRLNLTDADKAAILMVGDRKFDVLGAKECGIDCAGVEFFGYAACGELADAGAVAVVQTAEQLETFILEQ